MTGYENYINAVDPGVIQFENANEGRSYPFADNAVLDAGNGLTLPDSVIVDMRMVVPKGLDAFLSSVYISRTMVSVCMKILDESMRTAAALSCTVKAGDVKPYIPYRFEKLTGSEDVGGLVTFGDLDLDSMQGSYRFPDGVVGVAENAICRYTPAKLRKFIDPRTGEEISGDVRLEFSGYVKAESAPEGVRLALSDAANDVLLSKCDKASVANPCGATPVKSINGVLPDDKNRIVIWFH